jgi:hypothetical protein
MHDTLPAGLRKGQDVLDQIPPDLQKQVEAFQKAAKLQARASVDSLDVAIKAVQRDIVTASADERDVDVDLDAYRRLIVTRMLMQCIHESGFCELPPTLLEMLK